MGKQIKKIGVLTSGGDSPGMNAAIRAVVRSSLYYGIEAVGIYRGYEGMIEGDFESMDVRSVNHILGKGGTVLKSARCLEFHKPEVRAIAAKQLKEHGIDAVVAIGGNGTFTGAKLLWEEHDIPVIGVPGTIDNDLHGSDSTIGFDTANNIVLEAIDNIRNTALSHNRLFFVEVMGRESGYIAAYTGLASGAFSVLIPENETTFEDLIEKLDKGRRNGKTSSIVVVAEGNKWGGASEIKQLFKEKAPSYDAKVTILGHTQRGGNPTCFDRILASRLGVAAVEGLKEGKAGVMAGIIKNEVKYTSLEDAIQFKDSVDEEIVRVAEILSI
ncbi:MAG: 6-phosphofructokinase 1 [Flavobacteriales bacterium]|jgi:6-phosphofructokinase 1|tara:strand:+ start:17349 stop:18332 length:984 start_codon:yes stop_codon:yes gene_type:complete